VDEPWLQAADNLISQGKGLKKPENVLNNA
jgi:hypothetical protein